MVAASTYHERVERAILQLRRVQKGRLCLFVSDADCAHAQRGRSTARGEAGGGGWGASG